MNKKDTVIKAKINLCPPNIFPRNASWNIANERWKTAKEKKKEGIKIGSL